MRATGPEVEKPVRQERVQHSMPRAAARRVSGSEVSTWPSVMVAASVARVPENWSSPLAPERTITFRPASARTSRPISVWPEIAHTTLFRWVQAYASEIEKRIRPHLRPSNGSGRVDETYVRVKGCWMYLYRVVDSRGLTIDFLLSAKQDAEAAKRFSRKALAQPHTVNPRTITVDKNPAYLCAIEQMKEDGELWRFSRLRQCKLLNNRVEQDHRRMKHLVRPGLGFGSFHTARRTLAGYEVMAMVRKGQLRKIDGRDMRAQTNFVTELFQVAA